MTQTGPLDGIRVVEVAQNVAIPYCGRILASLGAEVVKVEPSAAGDAMRLLGTLPVPEGEPPEGGPYLGVNHGKKSVVLDLTNPEVTEPFEALIAWADVVLVAVKPVDIDRFDLSYERLSEINPSIIALDHRPFGPEGPFGGQGGYDVLMQGLSGMALSTGRGSSRGTYPSTVRPAFNDFGTGMNSAIAILAAIRHRDQTGEGQRVTSSLLGTALNFMTPILTRVDSIEHKGRERWEQAKAELPDDANFETMRTAYEQATGVNSAFQLYFRHYQTSDGFISVGCLSPALYRKFHAATGISVPAKVGLGGEDPAFQAIVAEAEGVFLARTTDEWMSTFTELGVPFSRFNLPHEVLDDPQLAANGMAVDIDHPNVGHYRTPALPFTMEKSLVLNDRPSPVLDADTDAALKAAGITPEQVKVLRDAGVIGWAGQR